ncbi:hypothetical protein H6G76_34800 [Nostoc sp. FACHB-152]|uniref:hypothetical protein n=1 Tax=Nostoc sp. FACHB-152 TaxID=2692837 RepID=UPI0016826919|nr:hypothetical protein [Nostoc sp. FACHB-152]MBD2452185.1 hypothetical protein [Nostoc sp. FACHB-152]
MSKLLPAKQAQLFANIYFNGLQNQLAYKRRNIQILLGRKLWQIYADIEKRLEVGKDGLDKFKNGNSKISMWI